MALHKNITPQQLADGNLDLIGKNQSFRMNFLYHEYIRMLHIISSDDYAAEVEEYLNYKAEQK